MSESKIAWPVITLMATGVLLLAAHINGAPDWVIFVIFFGWWAWLYIYARFFYKGSLGNSSPNSQEAVCSKAPHVEALPFIGHDAKPKPGIAYYVGLIKSGQYLRYGVSYVTEGQKGATALPELGRYLCYQDAVEKVDALNAGIGVTKRTARRMVQRWRG